MTSQFIVRPRQGLEKHRRVLGPAHRVPVVDHEERNPVDPHLQRVVDVAANLIAELPGRQHLLHVVTGQPDADGELGEAGRVRDVPAVGEVRLEELLGHCVALAPGRGVMNQPVRVERVRDDGPVIVERQADDLRPGRYCPPQPGGRSPSTSPCAPRDAATRCAWDRSSCPVAAENSSSRSRRRRSCGSWASAAFELPLADVAEGTDHVAPDLDLHGVAPGTAKFVLCNAIDQRRKVPVVLDAVRGAEAGGFVALERLEMHARQQQVPIDDHGGQLAIDAGEARCPSRRPGSQGSCAAGRLSGRRSRSRCGRCRVPTWRSRAKGAMRLIAPSIVRG